jgi:GNAT superfamily N-acetyltransferase
LGDPAKSRKRSLTPSGNGWAKFELFVASVETFALPSSGFSVRPVNTTNAVIFGEIVQAAFGLPPVAIEWFAALVGRVNWTTYIAWDGNTPVGSGAMFARDGAAWLGIGATLASFRRRGVQSALLARRVADARAMGIRTLTTETGYPASGESDFPSYRNVQRAGFSLACVRPNFKLGNQPVEGEAQKL